MPLPQSSRDYYRRQQALAVVVVTNAERLWASMSVDDLDGSWAPIRARLVALIVAAQLAATRDADRYVSDVLDETVQINEPAARLRPLGFVGTASDGRPLATLLDGAVVSTKSAIASGSAATEAIASGGSWLRMVSNTAVADAGRTASGVAIAVRPDVGGYTRMLNPPSCSRCVVLAGQFYRWNSGFLRHPGCDCRHIPSSENVAGDFTTSPFGYFSSLSAAEQNKTFTNAGAEAIRDGADIGRVVNARRPGAVYTTNTGTSATLELARGAIRPMPETIYSMAESRAEAINLLRRFGYITA